MAQFHRIYVDTNIFIELAEGHGERQQLLYELVACQMTEDAVFLCTSELTLAELLVHPYATRDDDLIQVYDNWIYQGSTWLDVGPVTRDTLWSAALVRRDYPSMKLPDAIHASTAIGFECSHFLTADKKIPTQIQITNDRWGIGRSSHTLRVIEPTTDILGDIIRERRQA